MGVFVGLCEGYKDITFYPTRTLVFFSSLLKIMMDRRMYLHK